MFLSAFFANIFLFLHLLWESSGEAEIAYLYAALVGKEYVAWLEVAMDYVGSVQEVDCAQKVVQNDLGMFHVKGNILVVIENLGQVLVDVAHDEEDAVWVLLFVVLLWDDDIDEFDSEDVVLHG